MVIVGFFVELGPKHFLGDGSFSSFFPGLYQMKIRIVYSYMLRRVAIGGNA